MTALAIIGALWATAIFVPVYCVPPVRAGAGHMANYSTISNEDIEVKIDELANNLLKQGVTADDTGLEDMEAYAFRRLLEKFVYALNLRTTIATLRQTVTGEITPGHVIAKIKEVLGEASSVS
ncbi:unnamed protein product [Ixodes hexagonus]